MPVVWFTLDNWSERLQAAKNLKIMKTLTVEQQAKFMAQNPTVLDVKDNSQSQTCTFYEHPIYGEDDYVYVKIGDKLASTGFYDIPDMFGDYEPVLFKGEISCRFELPENLYK